MYLPEALIKQPFFQPSSLFACVWVFFPLFLDFLLYCICFIVSLNLSVFSSNLCYSGIYLAIFFHLIRFCLFLYSLLSVSSLPLLAFHINHLHSSIASSVPAKTLQTYMHNPQCILHLPLTSQVHVSSPCMHKPICTSPDTHTETQRFLGSRNAISVYVYKII